MKTVKYRFTLRELDYLERIEPSDFHSLDGGKTLNPITHVETIGEVPVNFSRKRSFWRVISIK